MPSDYSSSSQWCVLDTITYLKDFDEKSNKFYGKMLELNQEVVDLQCKGLEVEAAFQNMLLGMLTSMLECD